MLDWYSKEMKNALRELILDLSNLEESIGQRGDFCFDDTAGRWADSSKPSTLASMIVSKLETQVRDEAINKINTTTS